MTQHPDTAFKTAAELPKSHRPPGPPERQQVCILCRVSQSISVMRRASDVDKSRQRGYVCDGCAYNRWRLGLLP